MAAAVPTYMKSVVRSAVKLNGATADVVAKTVADALYEGEAVTAKDISGNSGAKAWLCSKGEKKVCLVKIVTGLGISGTHAHTTKRMDAGTAAMREAGVAPKLLAKASHQHHI